MSKIRFITLRIHKDVVAHALTRLATNYDALLLTSANFVTLRYPLANRQVWNNSLYPARGIWNNSLYPQTLNFRKRRGRIVFYPRLFYSSIDPSSYGNLVGSLWLYIFGTTQARMFTTYNSSSSALQDYCIACPNFD